MKRKDNERGFGQGKRTRGRGVLAAVIGAGLIACGAVALGGVVPSLFNVSIVDVVSAESMDKGSTRAVTNATALSRSNGARPGEAALYKMLAYAEPWSVAQGEWVKLDSDALANRDVPIQVEGWKGAINVRVNGVNLYGSSEEAGLTVDDLTFDINGSDEARQGKYGDAEYGVARLSMTVENVDALFRNPETGDFEDGVRANLGEWRLNPCAIEGRVPQDELRLDSEFGYGGYFYAARVNAASDSVGLPVIGRGETADVSLYFWVPMRDLDTVREGRIGLEAHVGMLANNEGVAVFNNVLTFELSAAKV